MKFYQQFTPATLYNQPIDQQLARVYCFHQNHVIHQRDSEALYLSYHVFQHFNELIEHSVFIGCFQDIPYYAAKLIDREKLPDSLSCMLLKEAYFNLDAHQVQLANHALQLLHWDRRTLFCGHCGQTTQRLDTDGAKECIACKERFYPRISPAIMALIQDNDRILLARSPHFKPNHYSVIAGFVEPGESLEHAVHREVYEEVGVTVKNLRYFDSHAWPFPDSLMIGFICDYAGNDIKVDGVEIESAQWFTRDNLPDLPSPISLSRHLINAFLEDHNPS